jgi:predicted nucleotidyltransferase component of viral defense system
LEHYRSGKIAARRGAVMKRLYTKEYVERIAAREGFIKDNIEKVLRLTDILAFLNAEPTLKDKLALKGGTAINLTIMNFPRLSVDIDLDYAVNESKEKVAEFRARFKELLTDFVDSEGYRLTDGTRIHYALDSFMLGYIGTSGNRDNIKVEVNYLNRAHVLPLEHRRVHKRIAEDGLNVLSLSPTELYASKTVALLSRATPRDLYDMAGMIAENIIGDTELFRKCFVFYNVCGGGQNAETLDFSRLDRFSFDTIRRQLLPVLSKPDRFDYKQAAGVATDYLQRVLTLTDNEREFIRLFNKKKYLPELLFTDVSIIERIAAHPMALWRLR